MGMTDEEQEKIITQYRRECGWDGHNMLGDRDEIFYRVILSTGV